MTRPSARPSRASASSISIRRNPLRRDRKQNHRKRNASVARASESEQTIFEATFVSLSGLCGEITSTVSASTWMTEIKTTRIRWRWGIGAAIAMMLIALFPQLHFIAHRGPQWHGANAITHPDEVAYSAYVASLLRGSP